MTYVVAYLFSTVGGWLIPSLIVPQMHRTSGITGTTDNQLGDKRPYFRWLDVWGGFTERAIATTLVIWAPKVLPLYIGGWVVAKLAAGWSYSQTDQKFAPARVIALVGMAFSFSIAIAAGLWADPAAVADFGAIGD